MTVSAATNMFPDTVYRGSLDSLNAREDYNFTARANEWTVLAANNYQGTGAFRHGLRTDIASKNPILFAEVGSVQNIRSAGVIAINGYDLPGDTTFTVSEELAVYSPSYALQMRNGLVMLSGNSQTVKGNIGTDGVVMAYEVDLAKRDTLDLRLRIPPEWTYNYHFSLLLFSPTGRYHQYEGQGGTVPIATSDAGENSEQALVHVAQEPGVYLIVLLNEGVPDNIKFELDVGVNGVELLDGDLVEETLTGVNQEDFYRVTAPMSSWSAVVVKARGEVDRTFTQSLHWPTPDSNTIAKDELSDDSPVGIMAINGRALTFTDTYYPKVAYERGGTVVPFTIQFAEPHSTLPSTNGSVPGAITDTDIFRLYEINLQSSHTADFRLQVADDYNYDYDLGMYVFPPGEKYYSISGQLPDYASEPIAMSRAGENTEQNTVFTSPVTGVYAVVIVNFAARDNIPFNLDVTIQGRSLADDTPVTGDLNEHNREDLFQFQAGTDTWNLVGSRLSSADGALWHNLHSTALDTNPIRADPVGWHQAAGAKKGVTADNPVGLLAVDGHQLQVQTTYFIREEVEAGSPHYVLELETSPTALTAPFDLNMSRTFRPSEFLHTFTVDLAARDTIDIRVAPPREWTYPYSLGVYVLAPGSLYRNLATEGDVGGIAVPGESRNPSLVYTATTAGEHLVVVANLGDMISLDYDMSYAINGFPASTNVLNTGVLDADNVEDAFRFSPLSQAYTMVAVRLPENAPAATVKATLRWPTVDSVALSTLVLDGDDRVGAFVIDGRTLPAGNQRHFVHVTADVPGGRTVTYQVQVAFAGAIPLGTQNLTAQTIGAVWSPQVPEGSTADLGLRVPPGYTYSYDLGLYLFAPDATYMSTNDPETGPRAMSRNGPGTEQEIIFTSRSTAEYAALVLNHDVLTELGYDLNVTVDGRPLPGPVRSYVDDHNRNEHFRFTAGSNKWTVVSSAWVSGEGEHELKLLTTGLSTNPVAYVGVGPLENTGVIAINGWELDTPSRSMFINVSQVEGRHFFVVQAATDVVEFGAIGKSESGQFGDNAVVYVYFVNLTVSDHLDISLMYDQGNWSSDVHMELQIFEPVEAFSTTPVGTVGLKVTEGRTLIDGQGEFVADRTGAFAFVLVNKGPLGPMGFSMGVYRRSIVDHPPMYPAILDATSNTESITVKWAPNQEANFDRYEVWLSTASNDKGDKVDVITIQSKSDYTIEGLDDNQKYYVTIEVFNTAGLSTASNPWPISTKELEWYQEPLFYMVLAVIAVAIAFLVGFNWLIRKQKAETARASEEGATAALAEPGEDSGIEIEAIEEDRPRPRPAGGGEGADDSVRFMRQMQGEEEV